MEIINGIIIGISKFKDNDSIINVLTNSKIESILVNGGLNIKNKNNKYCKLFLYGEFETYTGGVGGKKLKTCNVINNFYNKFISFEDHTIADAISEVVFRYSIENSDYSGLLELLLDILNNYSDVKEINFSLALFIIYRIQKINGISLYLDEITQLKNIKYFSIDYDSGLIIRENEKNNDVYDINLINKINVFYNGDIAKVLSEKTNVQEFKILFNIANNISKNHFNTNLRSSSLVEIL